MPDKASEKPYSIFPEPPEFEAGTLNSLTTQTTANGTTLSVFGELKVEVMERMVKYEKSTQIGDVYTTTTIEGNANDVIEILKAEDKLLSDTEESESVRLTDMIIDRNEKG